jgi:hypothetical protein
VGIIVADEYFDVTIIEELDGILVLIIIRVTIFSWRGHAIVGAVETFVIVAVWTAVETDVEVMTPPVTVITFFWVKVIRRASVTVEIKVVGTLTELSIVVGTQLTFTVVVAIAVVVDVVVVVAVTRSVWISVADKLSVIVVIWPGRVAVEVI